MYKHKEDTKHILWHLPSAKSIDLHSPSITTITFCLNVFAYWLLMIFCFSLISLYFPESWSTHTKYNKNLTRSKEFTFPQRNITYFIVGEKHKNRGSHPLVYRRHLINKVDQASWAYTRVRSHKVYEDISWYMRISWRDQMDKRAHKRVASHKVFELT